MLILIVIAFTALIYLNSILLSERFSYSRQLSFSMTLLVGLSLPHAFAVLFSSVFNIGLINSLAIFATLFVAISFYLIYYGFGNLKKIILNDRNVLKNNRFELLVYSGILIVYLFVGVGFIPSTIDEIAYHIPQAVGALQENKLYEFSTNLPWVQGYPQGVAVLWAICIMMAGSDLYARLPQLLYLISIIFSLWNIFDEIGVNSKYRNFGVIAFLTMPIVYILGTTNRADLAYAAYMICMLSILVSDAERKEYSLTLILTIFLFSASVKIPVISTAVFLYFSSSLIICRASNFNKLRLAYFKSNISLVFSLILILSTLSLYIYWLNFNIHGNPIYPIHVEAFNRVIFEGPLKFFQVSGHSTFGGVNEFSKIRLWHAIYYDIFSPLNEDSYGSSGLIYSAFVLLFVIAAVVKSVSSIKEKKSRIILFTILFCLLPVVMPSQTLPRYHLIFSIIILVLAVYSAAQHLKNSKSILVALYILILPSVVVVGNNMWLRVKWVVAVAGEYDRGHMIQNKYLAMDGFGPDPSVVLFLKKNEYKKIYFCGNNFPALMWNKSYTNNLKYIGDVAGCDLSKINSDGLLINSGKELDLNGEGDYSIKKINQEFGISQLYNVVR